MGYRPRKYYIPKTRSGSSMAASLLTQAFQNAHRKAAYNKAQRHSRGDYTPLEMYAKDHPLAFLGWMVLGGFLFFVILILIGS
jgi:hypothetical protein